MVTRAGGRASEGSTPDMETVAGTPTVVMTGAGATMCACAPSPAIAALPHPASVEWQAAIASRMPGWPAGNGDGEAIAASAIAAAADTASTASSVGAAAMAGKAALGVFLARGGDGAPVAFASAGGSPPPPRSDASASMAAKAKIADDASSAPGMAMWAAPASQCRSSSATAAAAHTADAIA